MVDLTKRSDGWFETSDGLFAVEMLRQSGFDESRGVTWFDFLPSFRGKTIRVEWPTEAGIAVIDQNTAKRLVDLKYAVKMSDRGSEIWAAYIEGDLQEMLADEAARQQAAEQLMQEDEARRVAEQREKIEKQIAALPNSDPKVGDENGGNDNKGAQGDKNGGDNATKTGDDAKPKDATNAAPAPSKTSANADAKKDDAKKADSSASDKKDSGKQ